jgi:hypothetical protein
MNDSYLMLANEASVLCGQIAANVRELEEVEAAIAKEDREAAGGSGTGRTVNVTPVSKVRKPLVSTNMTPSRAKADDLDESAPAAATLTPLRAEGALLSPVLIALGSSMREDTDVSDGYVDFGTVTEDEDVTAMDHSSVDRMLKHSVRPSTLAKYSRLWDKWASFSVLHEVETVPPDMRALEIFIVNCAELAGSGGVANSTVAVVAHFTALEGWPAPCMTPRLSKILWEFATPMVRPPSRRNLFLGAISSFSWTWQGRDLFSIGGRRCLWRSAISSCCVGPRRLT